jgi:hypothetical protein
MKEFIYKYFFGGERKVLVKLAQFLVKIVKKKLFKIFLF